MIRATSVAALILGLSSPIPALGAPPVRVTSPHFLEVELETGVRANATSRPSVVFRQRLDLPRGTPWARVVFSSAHLDPGSAIRITSLLDGDSQTLDDAHLLHWGLSSAYFNGGSLLVELIAAPRSRNNSFSIDRVLAPEPRLDAPLAAEGLPPPETPLALCGNDNRNRSYDPGIARLMHPSLSTPATVFMIDRPAAGRDRCFLTAGHCFFFNNSSTLLPLPIPAVVQFMVPVAVGMTTVADPASNPDCTPRHPPCGKQFVVQTVSIRGFNGYPATSPGNDYAVFRCHPQYLTGKTAFEEQRDSHLEVVPQTLASVVPSTAINVRVIGFGIDGNEEENTASACSCAVAMGTRNHVQQEQATSFPEIVKFGSVIRHKVDTCAGNSGSPIFDITTAGNRVVGIHTNAGCQSGGSGYNSGTAADHGPLLAAIAAVDSMMLADPACLCFPAPALSSGALALLAVGLAGLGMIGSARARRGASS